VGRFVGAAHGCPVGFACEKILQSSSGYNLFKDFVFTGGFKFSFPMTLELQPCELCCLPTSSFYGDGEIGISKQVIVKGFLFFTWVFEKRNSKRLLALQVQCGCMLSCGILSKAVICCITLMNHKLHVRSENLSVA
jgi:hypothetical protein